MATDRTSSRRSSSWKVRARGRHLSAALVAAGVILAATTPGHGSGPRAVVGTGQPMRWSTAGPIVYNLDPGTLGSLTNAQADALVADAFARWQAIPLGALTFSAGSDLPGDVNAVGLPAGNPSHWAHFWRRDADGLSPVIYDADGSIIDAMFGVGARFDVLGAGGIDSPIAPAGAITGGSIVINGAFRDGLGQPGSPPDAVSTLAFEATIVHEVGHFLNLDHSLVNHELAGDDDPDNDLYVPTMYPLTVDDEEAIAALNPDDEAGAIGLYPSAGAAAGSWSIAGAVLGAGNIGFQGAQVIVRRTDNPLLYAYEAISGARHWPCNVGGACYPCGPLGCPVEPRAPGVYSIDGMTPGDYTVCVEQLDRRISLENGTFIGPLATPPVVPAPEECHDATESHDPTSDDPETAATLTQAAGSSVPTADILLNLMQLAPADPFEPNNSLAAASDLPDLVALEPRDTVIATLDASDLDVFKVSVVAGHFYSIDVEANELGSSLDPVAGLYDGSGTLVMVVDDAVDPDSGTLTPDPAVTYQATFTGLLRIVVSSYPDTDLDGAGGVTTGRYWLRVIHDQDSDGDQVVDRFDFFPLDPADDADGDGVSGPADNCPVVANIGQADADADGHGDACDSSTVLSSRMDSFRESNVADAYLGSAVAGVGDLNNDGRDDVTMGIPLWGDGAGVRGNFYQLYGTPAGLTSGGFWQTPADSAPGQYGAAFSAAGDINCDDYDDYIVGDPVDNWIDVWYGAPTATGGTWAGAFEGGLIDPAAPQFGGTISYAGDVNGDGSRDLLAGTWQHPGGGSLRGKAFLFLGEPPAACALPDTTPDWTAVGGVDGDAFGVSLASGGDVNGDGRDDVIVGSFGYTDGEASEGRAVLYLGMVAPPWLSASPWAVESNEADASLGWRVAMAGDINDDGYDDILVAAPWFDGAGLDRGRVLVYLGASGGPLTTPVATLDGDQDEANFGYSLAGVGDVNGDGFGDIAVGSPFYNEAVPLGDERGRVYLYLGNASGLTTTPALVLKGDRISARFGGAVAGAGDLNADGNADLIVGAYSYSFGQSAEGRAYTFLGTNGADRDGDGVGDVSDNCPDVPNPGQEDSDTAAGPDATCGTFDDNIVLFGHLNSCGALDNDIGDLVGDACSIWPIVPGFTSQGYRSGSQAWGDYDQDGDPDIWLGGTATSPAVGERLLRNDGGGAFTDVTASPMGGTTNRGTGAWADFNNDGRPDLVSADPTSGLRLLKNLGAGAFSVVTLPAMTTPQWFSWVDLDLDGDLDIYVAQGTGGGRLLRNDGGADLFTLITPAGLGTTSHNRTAFQDFDDDGDLDLYVGSGVCQYFENIGGGSFTARSTDPVFFCATFDWGDYDNDGDADLVSGWQVVRNDGLSAGAPVTTELGLLDRSGMTARWGDLDNDGDLDVARGAIHTNDGNDVFRRTDEASTRPYQALNHALADFDGDGLLDDLLSAPPSTGVQRTRLVRNQHPGGNHWLQVDLVGTVSNRSAIGARVTVTTGDVIQRRDVSSGSVSAPLRLHFGLGEARRVDRIEIRWPSGTVQRLHGIPADQILTIQEVDGSSPVVTSVLPRHGAVDASLYTNIILQFNKAIDPDTADRRSVSIARAGVKMPGTLRVSSDRFRIVFDPDDPLEADADYEVSVSADLADLFGNPAAPFASAFDTGPAAASLPIPATTVGDQQTGSVVGGANQDDQSGFAAAALEDVNGDGVADLLIGAPNVDHGGDADVGRVTLVLGAIGLQDGGSYLAIDYRGEGPSQFAGRAVADAGDLTGDGRPDFLIGAPLASPNGSGSGKAYLVFGNAGLDEAAPAEFALADLAACATPTLCGIVFEGEAAGDLAGLSLTGVGDINADGFPDLLIGAPGASPGGRTGAGRIYLVYGPLGIPGVIDLSAIGVTQPGLVFNGENPGDNAGVSLSRWDQFSGDGIDDLIIGAPGADSLDAFGATLADAGHVYAIHGGAGNLSPNPSSPATVELARVASGAVDQVLGIVFIGNRSDQVVGQSVTGEVDIDGDGEPDVIIGANQEAWIIPEEGPKTKSGTSTLNPSPTISPSGLIRSVGTKDALQEFGATVFTPGADGDIGDLVVAPAGDVNGDGVEDVIVGAGDADLPGKPDAGKAYIIFGSPDLPAGEIPLSEVGETFPGLVIEGAEAGDQLGASVSGGSDVNGDGLADVLIGAPFADSLPAAPTDSGETYIISLGVAGDVTGLTATHPASPAGAIFLEWDRASRAAGYNVYRGDVAMLIATGVVKTSEMTQLACGINLDSDADTFPDLTDEDLPGVGEGFFYLVTARNGTGESSIGAGTPTRVNDAQCP